VPRAISKSVRWAYLCSAILCSVVIVVSSLPTEAKPLSRQCSQVAASGTGVSETIAKFQVYEGLLQSAGVGLWAAWMADGTTPGYAVKAVKYNCVNGTGLGVTCRGRATICKR
jgi:hypothetical protein